MSSFISAAPVASGQVQSLDSVRGHSLPSDAVIMASSSLVTPTNQNTGSYALVESANALTLTTTGSVPVVTQSPFADLYKEGSIYFNGTVGNYISGTATGLMGTQWNTTGLTVEAWVNYPTFTGAGAVSGSVSQPYLVGQFQPAGATNYWGFGSNTLGYVTFFYFNGASQNITSSVPLSTNTWNHIAFSCLPGGATANVYVNGTSVASTSISGTPTVSLSVPLTLGQFNSFSPNLNCYVADVRITTGAALYTGASFTVPSAPLSTAATGVTQALIRAGQNSPTVQNGALTFDRGLKQFQNYGPQTFNIVTQGFTAIWRGAFTGTAGSYERIFEFISSSSSSTNNAGSNGILLSRNGTASSLYFTIQPLNNAGTPSAYGLTGGNLSQNVPYVVTARYSPVTQLLDLWVNGVFQASASATPAQLVGDRILGFTSVGWFSSATYTSMTSNVLAIYNRALSNVEIYNSYLALSTVPATPLQKTLEIGDINGTPALSVAGDGKVFMDSVGLTSNVLPWPPAAMTGYDTVINGGVYKARASSDNGANFAWMAFDKNTNNIWVASSAGYSTSASPYPYTGSYTMTDVNGTVYPGEWLQIQLSSQVTLSSYIITPSGTTTAAAKFFILGSRDGVNWFQLDSRSFSGWASNTPSTFTLATPATQAFNYFRISINQLNGNGGNAVINEWTLYGTADTSPSLTIAPATTFNTSVATPSLTGVAGSAFVPQDFSSSGLNIPAYVVSNTATAANTVAFSSFGPFAGEGSLYFGGGNSTSGYVQFPSSVTSLNFDISAQDVTIEFWVYAVRNTQPGPFIFRGPTPGSSTSEWQIYQDGSGMVFQVASVSTSPTTTKMAINQWNHVAATIQGTTVTLWLNGTSIAIATKSTSTYNSAYPVAIGTGNYATYYNGYLTNFRITRGQALYTTTFTPPTGPLQPIQGTTQAGLPYGTVLLLRNAPAPGRIQTTKFSGANSVGSSGTPSVLAFPPAAMTTYATALNAGYGQGTYVASASTEYSTGNYAWQVFDKSTSTIWAGNGAYSPGVPYAGTVATVDVSGTTYKGEWIQVQKPSSVVLTSYSILPQNAGGAVANAPGSWYLLGSRDGVNWNLVDQQTVTSAAWAINVYNTYQVKSSQAFTYFRLVFFTTSVGTLVAATELIYNGSIESVNVTADGRVGLGVVNPTRALEVAGDIVCTGTVSSGTGLMFRNKIINGDMRFNQRGGASGVAGTAGTSAVNYVGTDRWKVIPSITTGVIQQLQLQLVSSDIPFQYGFKYSTRWTASTALSNYSYVAIMQFVEHANWSDMAWMGSGQGSPCTLSFWFRAAATGQYCYAIRAGAGSGQSWVGTFNVGASGQWGYYQFTIPPPGGTGASWNNASTTDGFQVQIGGVVKTNTTSTPNQWSAVGSSPETATGYVDWPATLNNYVEFTGVQLEKGSVATPFEVRPYATELALCQRYYWSMPSGATVKMAPDSNNSTVRYYSSFLPVTMRASPTPTATVSTGGPGANYGTGPATFGWAVTGVAATTSIDISLMTASAEL